MSTMTQQRQLVNQRKRKPLSNQMNDDANRRTKRRRLDSLDDNTRDGSKIVMKSEDNSREFHRMSRPRLLPKRGIASMKCSFGGSYPDAHHSSVVSDHSGLESVGRELKLSYGNGYSQSSGTKDKVPRSLVYEDEPQKLSMLVCGMKHHNPEDPYAIEGKNQRIKGEPVSPDSSPLSLSYPVLPPNSNVILEGCVHTLTSLNARACVAAYLQPDKKAPSKRRRRGSSRWCKRKVRSKSKLNDESAVLDTTCSPKQVVLNVEESTSNPVILNVSGVENVIPVITFSGMKMPPCAVLVEGLKDQPNEQGQMSYNTMGLLHNGDTLHPHARVFLEGSHELHLPSKIVPTLVPARQSTVRRAVKKAISDGVARRHRKPAKRKNNGWCPLGEPIKVIDNQAEGLCRAFYAGIKRKNEEIFVRDCVVINAGTEKRKNSYVAKIGSIWRESDGALMMTTFWYYQPDDLEVRQAGIQCVEKEILASQHHDVNSVACIEDKCYVVGLKQYCRYHASMLKDKISDHVGRIHSQGMVPPLPATTTTALCKPVMVDTDLVELDPKKQQQEELGPSLSQLQQADSALVFLCHRGFNHITDKLQSGKLTIPRL